MPSSNPSPFDHFISRRGLLKGALAAGGALALGRTALRASTARADSAVASTPIRFTPFTADMPVPQVLSPTAAFSSAATSQLQPAWGTSAPRYYQVTQRTATTEIIPGVPTEVLTYDGLYPGPTIRARLNEPAIVRFSNALDRELSVHQHGGHTPSASDGFPNDFIQPGASKDYCYPNIVPDDDPSEVQSTMWYHDHAMDITGENVYRGLAAFYLVSDALEDGLVGSNVLPGGAFDVPVVLQDKALNSDGSLYFNNFEHNGFLGDLLLANGKAQPRFVVQRRKYRFRFLNGANARIFMLRLSNGQPFVQVGADSWLLPTALQRDTLLLGMAERADVIVDFRNAPNELFLENIMVQGSGAGPDGTVASPPTQIPGKPIIKFVVQGSPVPNDATIDVGRTLRPHHAITAAEVATTRTFEFDRGNGGYVVNDRFFDPSRAGATPKRGTAERWILRNKGGGWWHPIHIHLEAHQVQKFNGRAPAAWNSFKKDTTLLGGDDEAEVFIKFRTHTGPYVFHCHNLEHEDMRMMVRFDVVG
jgi:FtsP/CotA-like multicopper oxidase with cupredoxin domain